jgi:PAS domain S-box-containing protein
VRDEELHRSEERYRQLFNSVDEGLCIVEIVFDPTGRPVDYIFREVNPAFEKQTGLTDPIGKSIRSLAPAHESFWMETYAQVLRTGQPVRFQNEARALDRWYDVYAFRLDVEQRVAVLFNDITARVRADHSLREADRRKDEFLAMLAHELRNPLAPIRAAAHVLKRGAPQPADLRKATEIILRQVVHMTGLVEELVDVSRLTRGLVTLQKTQVDLRQVLDAAVEQARPLMDARDHRLAVALPPRPAFVLGDGSRLVQLVANLLGGTPSRAVTSACVCRSPMVGQSSRSKTTASVCPPRTCPRSSSSSFRPNARRTAPRAGWASAWRWCAAWPTSTAEACKRTATAWEGAAASP